MANKEKYPLVEKALLEQCAVFSRFDDGLPPELEQATHRAIDILESCLDRPDDFKQDVMAASVLMNCPPYILLKSPRFSDDYNPHIQSMLNHHVNGEGLTGSDEGLVQIYGALFIAHGENFLAKIKTLRNTDQSWIDDVRESIEEYRADRLEIQSRIAPRLFALEKSVLDETIAALDLAATPQKDTTPRLPPPKGHHPPSF